MQEILCAQIIRNGLSIEGSNDSIKYRKTVFLIFNSMRSTRSCQMGPKGVLTFHITLIQFFVFNVKFRKKDELNAE